jgi:hypothetical protein
MPERSGTLATETERPLTGALQLVTSEDLARFAGVSASYGRWNATPAENERRPSESLCWCRG